MDLPSPVGMGFFLQIPPGFGTIMLGLLATWRATAGGPDFCPFEKGLEDILQIVEDDFN